MSCLNGTKVSVGKVNTSTKTVVAEKTNVVDTAATIDCTPFDPFFNMKPVPDISDPNVAENFKKHYESFSYSTWEEIPECPFSYYTPSQEKASDL
jgi:hypothetical protein